MSLQLANVIDAIKNRPEDRRIIMCAWNPADLNKMALPPCHCLVQVRFCDSAMCGSNRLRFRHLSCPYHFSVTLRSETVGPLLCNMSLLCISIQYQKLRCEVRLTRMVCSSEL